MATVTWPDLWASQGASTKVGGLIVGIVAYIAYNHLVVRTNKVVYQMEANSVEFLDHLNEPI